MQPPLLLLPLLWAGSLAQDGTLQLQVPELVTVQEGLCVLVPCEFFYPQPWNYWAISSSVYGSWYKGGAEQDQDAPVATNHPERTAQEQTRGRFLLLGDTKANNCFLAIRDAQSGDAGVYFFTAERPSRVIHHYREKGVSVWVTALTYTPDILIPGILESGRPNNLTCSVPWACEQGTAPLFSWTSAAPTSLGSRTTHSSVLTLIPRPQDHGTNLTCQVRLPGAGVTTERTVRLSVSYAPQNMALSVLQGDSTVLKVPQNTWLLPVLEGQALRLLCAADSNPPAELSWFRGSPALNDTPISSNASLELPQVGPEEEGGLTCEARNPLGSLSVFLNLSVIYPPQLLGPSCSWEAQGLHCSCSSRALLAPSLRWWLGEQLLEGNSSDASFTITSSSAGPWANGSLSLRGPLSSDLRLSCEARNAHGVQSLAVLLLPGQGIPRPRTGSVLGAVGGAVVTVSVFLCLCLILRVKTLRKRAAQKVRSGHGGSPEAGSSSGGPQQQPWTSTPAEPAAPAGTGPVSGKKREPHYTFLRFQRLRQQEQEHSSSDIGTASERPAQPAPKLSADSLS